MDTSALIAILLNEPEAEACIDLLAGDPEVLISAGTFAEALIVAGRRNVGDEMVRLIDGLAFEVVPVTADVARSVEEAYRRWGKGIDPAALNFGDCFAYALTKERECPLLCLGDDFRRTDLRTIP